MTFRVVIVCNALDDVTRQQRGITTDSPAASRKIFMLCEALRLAGVRPLVLSLGRGRAGGSLDYFAPTLRRVNGVAVLYAPFSRLRLVSELISLFAPLGLLRALCRRGSSSVVFYNRMTAYLPTLMLSSVVGNRNFLDLEDGEVAGDDGKVRRWINSAVKQAFDKLCDRGALLACNALQAYTRIRPTLSYYGTASDMDNAPRFQARTVSVLMGGTLSPDTGADLLIEAIAHMRISGEAWVSRLAIHVTGGGPSLAKFHALAGAPGYPVLQVHGRTTNAEYASVLRMCDVGLALKLQAGALADTTFPSKVIEYAAAGMLVLTTDISDIRLVLGDGALYLSQDSPEQLERLLECVVDDQTGAQSMATLGRNRVKEKCAPVAAGRMVADFLADKQ